MEAIKVKNLVDYSKCPNYCKFNWINHPTVDGKTSAIRRIIQSCYRDQANFERKIVWKTVRSRVHTELSPLLGDLSLEDYHKMAIRVIDSLRGWYLNHYREGPELCLYGLALKANVPDLGISLEGSVSALLLEENNISAVLIGTEYEDPLSTYRSMELRAIAWLLAQHGVIINSFLVINIKNDTIKTYRLKVDNPDDYIYKASKAVQLIAGGIKHNILYPSVSDMCNTCAYRSICS